jgi:flagellar basal body-associated protein FliL
MKNKNLIVITLLATVLLCSAFVSLAAADDNVSDVTTPPEPSVAPDPSTADSNDNSTTNQGDNVLYTIQENSTTTDDTQIPGEAQPNLTATQTATSDNSLLIAAIATVLAIAVGGVIGVFFYRKKN